jgi:hypothetical protein
VVELEGILDSGFNSGVLSDKDLHEKLKTAGLSATDSSITVGDNREVDCWTYPFFLSELLEPPLKLDPPRPMLLHCQEDGDPLLGFEAMKSWVSEFDGPKSLFRVTLP